MLAIDERAARGVRNVTPMTASELAQTSAIDLVARSERSILDARAGELA